jgi:hypothetical protein
MDADLLLQWMSETSCGTVPVLRRRADWLARGGRAAPPPAASGRWLRDLSALGHAEIDWHAGKWSIAPAVLTRLPHADGTAILAGSRRTGLVPRLADDLDTHEVAQPPVGDDLPLPAAVLVRYDSTASLVDAARSCGAAYVPCAAQAIAARLPALSLRTPAAPPAAANTTLERYDADTGRFQPAAAASGDGAYRLVRAGRPAYLFCRGGAWSSCSRPEAVFAELARLGRQVMRWRPDGSGRPGRPGTLFVDWGAPLPPLHTRALVLCSGLAVRFSGSARTGKYINVPAAIATSVASSLSQQLQDG